MQVAINKSGTAALWLIALVLSARLLVDHVWPLLYFAAHKEQFAELMVECDSAMHVEADAAAAARSKEAGNDSALIAAEVQLTVCHEYDILRKKMLINGVKEDSLSLLGLRTMERRGVPLKDMIAPHVIPRANGAP